MALIRRAVASIPATADAHLGRWMEYRVQPYLVDATGAINWDGKLIGKWGTGLGTSEINPLFLNSQGSTMGVVVGIDGVRAVQQRPAVEAGTQAHYRIGILRRTATENIFHAFRRDFLPVFSAPANGFGAPLATCVEAWFRKFNNVDDTHATMCFGFTTQPGNDGTNRGVHCGLLGDGAQGFRFGSIAGPDGTAAFNSIGKTDIDANSVQPAGLVNPGTNWFHVRIKLVPPDSPSTTGRWLAYLNGQHVATFDQLVNMPRGDNGNDTQFRGIAHILCGGANSAPAGGQAVGWIVHDWNYWLDEYLGV